MVSDSNSTDFAGLREPWNTPGPWATWRWLVDVERLFRSLSKELLGVKVLVGTGTQQGKRVVPHGSETRNSPNAPAFSHGTEELYSSRTGSRGGV